jgi:hypothetical protein
MTKAQMPEGNSSGQCDPVTGDALQHQQYSSNSSSAMPLRMISPSSSSTAYDNSHYLPLSPPSTPPTSPREEASSTSWASRAGASAKETTERHNEARLREALVSIAIQNKPELPDTPDSTPVVLSPAELMVRHQPSLCARDFVQTVLPRLRAIGQGGRRYLVEDAGMELVCPGWTGAVLVDAKAHTNPSTQSKSASSSFSSTRMSRTSSHSSHQLTHPRRTLLTRIAASLLDTADLRSSILDALDHATEKLQVDNVVFVLDRSGLDDEKFRAIVHGLCYVGASVVGHGSVGEALHAKGQAQDRDQEEDVHHPTHVSPGLVLLSVDV